MTRILHTLTTLLACALLGAPRAQATELVGDCDGNGCVEINELVTAVNIALGSFPLSACPATTCNTCGDTFAPLCLEDVSIACVVQAVDNAMQPCTPPACDFACAFCAPEDCGEFPSVMLPDGRRLTCAISICATDDLAVCLPAFAAAHPTNCTVEQVTP